MKRPEDGAQVTVTVLKLRCFHRPSSSSPRLSGAGPLLESQRSLGAGPETTMTSGYLPHTNLLYLHILCIYPINHTDEMVRTEWLQEASKDYNPFPGICLRVENAPAASPLQHTGSSTPCTDGGTSALVSVGHREQWQ